MKNFIIIFHPKKPALLNSVWPWWEFTVLDQKLIRMLVKAENKDEAMKEVYKTHIPLHDKDFIAIETVYCGESKNDSDFFNEQFPKEKWMKWE